MKVQSTPSDISAGQAKFRIRALACGIGSHPTGFSHPIKRAREPPHQEPVGGARASAAKSAPPAPR